MKRRKTGKKGGGQSSRRGGHHPPLPPQQYQQSLHCQTAKERVFQVRRQAQFLTRPAEVKAGSYNELKVGAAAAFDIEDLDSFTLRELQLMSTPSSIGEDPCNFETASFAQIPTDLLLTPNDELPIMPGLHSIHMHTRIHSKISHNFMGIQAYI